MPYYLGHQALLISPRDRVPSYLWTLLAGTGGLAGLAGLADHHLRDLGSLPQLLSPSPTPATAYALRCHFGIARVSHAQAEKWSGSPSQPLGGRSAAHTPTSFLIGLDQHVNLGSLLSKFLA